MDIRDKYQLAIRDVLKDHTIKEIALTLYEVYGDRRPYQTFYAEVKSKFSADTRTRFDFCDVVIIMLLFGNYEPLYATCELLGLERPQVADSSALLQANIRELNKLRSLARDAEQRISLLSGQARLSYLPPDLSNARFAAGRVH